MRSRNGTRVAYDRGYGPWLPLIVQGDLGHVGQEVWYSRLKEDICVEEAQLFRSSSGMHYEGHTPCYRARERCENVRLGFYISRI